MKAEVEKRVMAATVARTKPPVFNPLLSCTTVPVAAYQVLYYLGARGHPPNFWCICLKKKDMARRK